MSPDFYGLLGVAANASQQDIDRAYAAAKAKVRKAAAGDGGTDESRAIETAYGVLRDPAKRKAYDRIRAREATPPASRTTVPPPGPPSTDRRSANVLIRLWRGEFPPGLVFLLLVLLPFGATYLLPSRSLWVNLGFGLWFVVAAIFLWRSAAGVHSGFGRFVTRAFVVLMLMYQIVAIPGAWYLDKFRAPLMASRGALGGNAAAEGCVNPEALILQAVTGGRTASPAETEFRKTQEGQYLAAAAAGDIRGVTRFLDQGVNIAARDKVRPYWDNSALDHAARTDNVELARLLLSKGLDVNSRSTAGHTALHVATGLGRAKMAEFLLKNGADTSIQDRRTGTPLEVAVLQARPSMARLLVQHGAHTGGSGRASPLVAISKAASLCNGHREIIKYLAKDSATLFAHGEEGNTAAVALVSRGDDTAMILAREYPALDWSTAVTWGKRQVPLLMVAACAPRSHETVQHLLTAHPQKDRWRASVTGPWGSLLHCAAEIKPGHWSETVAALMSDVNVRDAEGRTPLHRAYKLEFVQALLAKGADVNAQDVAGQTPLMLVGHAEDTARLLLDRGADASIRDAKGQTVMHRAVSHNTIGLVRLLIERRIDVNLLDANGDPPLHFFRSREMANLLFSAGAKVDMQGAEGRSALHVTALRGDVDMAKVLIERGARLNQADSSGNSPIHLAALRGGPYMLEMLLKAGADPKAKNREGKTPFDLAMQNPRSEHLVRVLRGENAAAAR